ncbi:hypothetical protein B0H11DRAFT_2054741 [Mycena galericulata]|nr:hypothetical protein B0H11DRAFT_2054741 [Mycena galericulata]
MLGPRSIDSHYISAPAFQHQRSTKLLISRFESLSDAKPISGATTTSPAKSPLCPPKQTESKKDKSPIRQSFHNLLAVLKKSSGLRLGKSKHVQIPDTSLSTDDPFTVSTKTFPGPRLAGSLFYLAHSQETQQVLSSIWTFCSAILEDDTVHLTWQTTPCTHSILLKNCSDVRSLTSSQLDPEERALLPGDVRDLKVFEILFSGHTVEKFATTSVRERARWVSAIWDVVLPSVNGSSLYKEDREEKFTTDPDTPLSDSSFQSRPSTICLERALPPVPEQVASPIQPARSPSPRVLLSPSIHPPSRPGSPTSSRPRSPSIAKLGHMSVVRQRLAQIEGCPQSAPNSPSALSRNSSILHTKLRVRTVFEAEDIGPASPTSIMESYGATYPVSKHEISPSVEIAQEEHRPQLCSEAIHAPHQIAAISTASPCTPSDAHHPILTDIHQMMTGVVRRTEQTGSTLDTIQNTIDQQCTRAELESAAIAQTLGDIHQRLRSDLPSIMTLLAEIQTYQMKTESKTVPTSASRSIEAPEKCDLSEKLNNILEILQEETVQRSMQTHQQTDIVRYLNELNSWLEAFVSGGTAQIGVVAAGVEKLCQDLGSSDENPSGGRSSIIPDIRQLVSDGQGREQNAAALQLSVNSLAALIGSESRNNFSAQSIVNLIDQQRQDQEGLLRALAAELSEEIRGERLRFVDAMKEATAINVQMHVEQLKTELAREVRADLFAFYSKQKPHGVSRPMYAQQPTTAPPPRALPNAQYAVYP